MEELPSNYQDTRNEPTVGLFAAYSGTYEGREYTAKLSAAYNNENYNITKVPGCGTKCAASVARETLADTSADAIAQTVVFETTFRLGTDSIPLW